MTDHRNDWTYLASPNATSILETLQAWSVRGDAPGILAFVCDTAADLALVPALQRAATQLDMPLGGVIVPGVLIPGPSSGVASCSPRGIGRQQAPSCRSRRRMDERLTPRATR